MARFQRRIISIPDQVSRRPSLVVFRLALSSGASPPIRTLCLRRNTYLYIQSCEEPVYLLRLTQHLLDPQIFPLCRVFSILVDHNEPPNRPQLSAPSLVTELTNAINRRQQLEKVDKQVILLTL